MPLNSSLTFQKLLWFHATYDWVYIILMVGGQLNRIQTRDNMMKHVGILIALLVWIPVEILRLKSGYQGNINETFPDLILFLGTTVCSLVLNFVPFVEYNERLPHELSCLAINIIFTVFELIVGFAVGLKFIKSHFASFKLRTAPIIDRKFQQKYARTMDVNATREIELGMQRFDSQHDRHNPFERSDAFQNSKT